MIVWLTFEDGALAHDGDLRRLGSGLSFLGGLLGLAVAGLGRGASRLSGLGAEPK